MIAMVYVPRPPYRGDANFASMPIFTRLYLLVLDRDDSWARGLTVRRRQESPLS